MKDKKEIVSINFEDEKPKKKRIINSKNFDNENEESLTLTEKENEGLRRKVEMMERRFEELAEKIDIQNNVKINSEIQGKFEGSLVKSTSQKSPEPEEENSPLDEELDLICQKVNEVSMIEEKEGFFRRKLNFFKRKNKNAEITSQLPIIPSIPLTSNNEITLQTDEDYNKPERCPLCNSKIKKGTTQKNGEFVSQVFKCKNKNCTFVKVFKFRRGA